MEDFIMVYLPILILLLIGFIRNSVDGVKPPGLMNLSDINNKWSFDETWISRLTPIFSIIVIAYNFVIWV